MKNSVFSVVRVISLCLFVIILFVCVDFYLNYQAATITEDGSIACTSVLHRLFGVFGDHGWTIHGFYNAFSVSLWAALLICAENIALTCCAIIKKQ